MAEFAPLDGELAAMSDVVVRGDAGLLNEDELDRLATEIPDMRTRLGIRCVWQIARYGIRKFFSLCRPQL